MYGLDNVQAGKMVEFEDGLALNLGKRINVENVFGDDRTLRKETKGQKLR